MRRANLSIRRSFLSRNNAFARRKFVAFCIKYLSILNVCATEEQQMNDNDSQTVKDDELDCDGPEEGRCFLFIDASISLFSRPLSVSLWRIQRESDFPFVLELNLVTRRGLRSKGKTIQLVLVWPLERNFVRILQETPHIVNLPSFLAKWSKWSKRFNTTPSTMTEAVLPNLQFARSHPRRVQQYGECKDSLMKTNQRGATWRVFRAVLV